MAKYICGNLFVVKWRGGLDNRHFLRVKCVGCNGKFLAAPCDWIAVLSSVDERCELECWLEDGGCRGVLVHCEWS